MLLVAIAASGLTIYLLLVQRLDAFLPSGSFSGEHQCDRAEKLLSLLSGLQKKSLAAEGSVTNITKAVALRKRLAEVRRSSKKVRLSVGSKIQQVDGFISSNIDELNILREEDWQRLLANPEVCGADSLFAEHVFEHLTPTQVMRAAAASMKALRPGGHWRIAVPDAYFPNEWYQKYARAGQILSTQPHMVMWSVDTLPQLFEVAGYIVEILEYHDLSGDFHKVQYNEEGGRVGRTPANDPRNRGEYLPGFGWDPNWVNGSLMMASLVFDAVKPTQCPLQL